MNTVVLVICLILIGIQLLVVLPMYFLKKNARQHAQKEFEEYVRNMVILDKQYSQHSRQLNQNLNLVNYWLKNGRDPASDNSDALEEEKRQRYLNGQMAPREANEYVHAVRRSENIVELPPDDFVKSLRRNEFETEELDECDVEQNEMHFYYNSEFAEQIYYCVTPQPLKNKFYKSVIYFTTARPAEIPMVYPHKYEGAQMLSLYKHPAQAIWFLTNWKAIREAMEHNMEEEVSEIKEAITDFDL